MIYPSDAAFPQKVGDWHAEVLTKREYFAAIALQRVLDSSFWPITDGSMASCANVAVGFADALIAELNKPTPEKP